MPLVAQAGFCFIGLGKQLGEARILSICKVQSTLCHTGHCTHNQHQAQVTGNAAQVGGRQSIPVFLAAFWSTRIYVTAAAHSSIKAHPSAWLAAFQSSSALPPPPAQKVVYLFQLDLELASTLHRSSKSIQILAPEGKELLNAQAAERVITGVADPVLLAHVHHLVVHVQGVLQWKGQTQTGTRTEQQHLTPPATSLSPATRAQELCSTGMQYWAGKLPLVPAGSFPVVQTRHLTTWSQLGKCFRFMHASNCFN